MKINRRTMLKVSGVALGALALPEIRQPVAYIVTHDSWHPFEFNGRRVITRTWSVYWSWHPELNKRLSAERYKWSKNVKVEAFYNTESFPPPALEPLKLRSPLEPKKLTDYEEYHCFRTYGVECSGRIKVIYNNDGSIA